MVLNGSHIKSSVKLYLFPHNLKGKHWCFLFFFLFFLFYVYNHSIPTLIWESIYNLSFLHCCIFAWQTWKDEPFWAIIWMLLNHIFNIAWRNFFFTLYPNKQDIHQQNLFTLELILCAYSSHQKCLLLIVSPGSVFLIERDILIDFLLNPIHE